MRVSTATDSIRATTKFEEIIREFKYNLITCYVSHFFCYELRPHLFLLTVLPAPRSYIVNRRKVSVKVFDILKFFLWVFFLFFFFWNLRISRLLLLIFFFILAFKSQGGTPFFGFALSYCFLFYRLQFSFKDCQTCYNFCFIPRKTYYCFIRVF